MTQREAVEGWNHVSFETCNSEVKDNLLDPQIKGESESAMSCLLSLGNASGVSKMFMDASDKVESRWFVPHNTSRMGEIVDVHKELQCTGSYIEILCCPWRMCSSVPQSQQFFRNS